MNDTLDLDDDLEKRQIRTVTARWFHVGFGRDADNRGRVFFQTPDNPDGWYMTAESATSLAAKLLQRAEEMREHRVEARTFSR